MTPGEDVPEAAGPGERAFRLAFQPNLPACAAEPGAAACVLGERAAGPPAPRPAPLFFDVDPAVANPAREARLRFENWASQSIAPSFLLRLPGGSVLSEGFLVADREGGLVAESFRAAGLLARYGFREAGPRAFTRAVGRVAELPGRAVVLGIQTNRNYFHWLIEALPRLVLAREAGLLEGSVLLLPPMTPWMEAMLDAVGDGGARRVTMDADELRCGELILAARGLSNIHTPAWHALALLDALAPPRPARRGKRLFVSRARAASRRIANEEALLALAARHGFTAVRPETLSFQEQIALFADAEAVAGPLGAGLANAAFMPQGAALIEFAPEGREGDSVLFANLAALRGQRYLGAVGPFHGGADRPFDRRDFTISERAAAACFAALDAG